MINRTNSVRVALLGSGLAVLLGLGGAASNRSQAQGPAPAEGPMGFMRCPECGLEFASPERKVLCSRCGQKKVQMVFSTTSGGGVPGEPAYSWRFPLIVAGVVLFLAAALLLLNRPKKAREALKGAEVRERLRQDAERERVVRQQEAYQYRSARRRKGK
jgi:hypothetical protein